MLRARLKRYRQRQLDETANYKPLDVGAGGLTASVDQYGRIIALNAYHRQHGYMTLATTPPFNESDRYTPPRVRAYRLQLAQQGGFGVDVRAETLTHTAYLLEEAIPFQHLTLRDGSTADVVTFVPVAQPAAIVQIWHFSASDTARRLTGRVWLQRAAYTQLTEGGPVTMPDVTTTATIEQETVTLTNRALDGHACLNATSATANPDGSVTILADRLSSSADGLVPIIISLADSHATATANFQQIHAESALTLLYETLDYWRDRWSDWPHNHHPLDDAIRRGLTYSELCTVPVTDTATAIMTDHMLLPLSWNRDSYYSARAFLLSGWRTARDHVRGHLIWLFTHAQRADDLWGRSYLLNGRIKDAGYQLDQQIFPLIELAEYVQITGDRTLLPDVRPVVMDVITRLLDSRHPSRWLFPTAETPADDPIAYAYHFSSHLLFWRALNLLIATDIDTGHDLPAISKALRAEIDRAFITSHNDHPIYAYATDGDGQHHLYHDANDIPLAMAPLWGFVSADDPIWRNTVDFAFSEDNIGGYYAGRLGSVHTAAPWPLGDLQELIIAHTTQNPLRSAAVMRHLRQSTQWDGALSEAVDAHSGVVASRHWFAWPNALLACLILAHSH